MTEAKRTATLSEHAEKIQAAIKAAEQDGLSVNIDNRCGGCCSDFEIYISDGEECVDLEV